MTCGSDNIDMLVLLKVSIALWVAIQWFPCMDWRNRWLKLFVRKVEPFLVFFSMDTKWEMYTSGKDVGWTIHEVFSIQVKLEDGRIIQFSDIFYGGGIYHLFISKNMGNHLLRADHAAFVERESIRLGFRPVEVQILRSHKNRPSVEVSFWESYDHNKFLREPFKVELIYSHQCQRHSNEQKTIKVAA